MWGLKKIEIKVVPHTFFKAQLLSPPQFPARVIVADVLAMAPAGIGTIHCSHTPSVTVEGSDDQGPSGDEGAQSIIWAIQLLFIHVPSGAHPWGLHHTAQEAGFWRNQLILQSGTKKREKKKKRVKGKRNIRKKTGYWIHSQNGVFPLIHD